uniref:Uncharacterized protein n=1 Tax=Arundo donax TaxID=35708 RepID=A0A0A9VBR5_ARUDO
MRLAPWTLSSPSMSRPTSRARRETVSRRRNRKRRSAASGC